MCWQVAHPLCTMEGTLQILNVKYLIIQTFFLTAYQPFSLMFNVCSAAPLIPQFPPPTQVLSFQTSASCPALCVCVLLCVCNCVHPSMCAHKGRRLSLIAQAHLLILGNRLASYRQKQRRQKKNPLRHRQTHTNTNTRHKCHPQSLQLGPRTICTLLLAAVWTALTGMVYNMGSIVLGQRPPHSRQRSCYKTISLCLGGGDRRQ